MKSVNEYLKIPVNDVLMTPVKDLPFSFTELRDTVAQWLGDQEQSSVEFDVDEQSFIVERFAHSIRCTIALPFEYRSGDLLVEKLLRIAAVSLGTFSGALALNPDTKKFCLVKSLPFATSAEEIIQTIEMLSNQHDVWQEVAGKGRAGERLSSPVSVLGINTFRGRYA